MYGPLAVLLAAGVGLRLVAMLPDWPAFFANPDAFSYMDAARDELFKYAERPAGYPAFLRAVHSRSDLRLIFPATIVAPAPARDRERLCSSYATVQAAGSLAPAGASCPTAVVLPSGAT